MFFFIENQLFTIFNLILAYTKFLEHQNKKKVSTYI